jgi:beta-phosphoglucomutase-like phosphatase (HAD superfamily)
MTLMRPGLFRAHSPGVSSSLRTRRTGRQRHPGALEPRAGRRRAHRPPAPEPEPERSVAVAATDVETLRGLWAVAFDAAGGALSSAGGMLPAEELVVRSERLRSERGQTAELLRAYARNQGASAYHRYVVLSPVVARRLLRLPVHVSACVFNLDGVLIGSAELHCAAWTRTFDELLDRRSERTRHRFEPFSAQRDYPAHIHGRPRLDGVRGFLASRGISLAEGFPSDLPGAETVHGLANRKNQVLHSLLERHEVDAYDGARRYLGLARDASLPCAVVSASANTDLFLERSGLAGLIARSIDGSDILERGLAPRPAPDILLASTRELGVEPWQTAIFETSRAGVEAAVAGGFQYVVAVDRHGRDRSLLEAGADRVASSLADLLDEPPPP